MKLSRSHLLLFGNAHLKLLEIVTTDNSIVWHHKIVAVMALYTIKTGAKTYGIPKYVFAVPRQGHYAYFRSTQFMGTVDRPWHHQLEHNVDSGLCTPVPSCCNDVVDTYMKLVHDVPEDNIPDGYPTQEARKILLRAVTIFVNHVIDDWQEESTFSKRRLRELFCRALFHEVLAQLHQENNYSTLFGEEAEDKYIDIHSIIPENGDLEADTIEAMCHRMLCHVHAFYGAYETICTQLQS